MPPTLRSRQVSLPKSPPPSPPQSPLKSTPRKTLTKKLSSATATGEPATPNPVHEPSVSTRRRLGLGSDSVSSSVPLRRSLRLNRNSGSGGGENVAFVSLSGGGRKRRRRSVKAEIEMDSAGLGGGIGKGSSEDFVALGLSSMDHVVSISDSDDEVKVLNLEECGGGRDSEDARKGMKRKFGDHLDFEGENSESFLSLSSGASVEKRVSGVGTNEMLCGNAYSVKGKGILIGGVSEDGHDTGRSENANVKDAMPTAKRFSREEKGKSIMIESDPLLSNNASLDLDLKLGAVALDLNAEPDLASDQTCSKVISELSDELNAVIQLLHLQNREPVVADGSARLNERVRENNLILAGLGDKLKAMVERVHLQNPGNDQEHVASEARERLKELAKENASRLAVLSDELQDALVRVNSQNPGNNRAPVVVEGRARFREIARENASRFARVSSIQQAENEVDSDPETEAVHEQAGQNIEDWPGPFSTAMKIIRDRINKANGQAQSISVDKTGGPKVIWTPRTKQGSDGKTRIVPSLQDLCMRLLARNSDAITSLEYVPEVLVHKLVSMLCDSRKMTGGILDLLFQGSPSEIRITDCSWIAEEQFTKSFEGCNTEKLMVLQLDLCGRCMTDYIVPATLASKGLPVLTTLSLKGACRLSDVGLKSLISSAPALKSINLSECSLLTGHGINAMADSLGPGLRELYLDDCQNLDMKLILPGLRRLTNLEVLSLLGIPSVGDKYLKELVRSNGQNMKELVLADCVKLSDSSLKAISENCCQLFALDLINVTKLTDTGIGYIANSCRAIQTLKFCRNTFSDEAIAAFLEAAGESLKELSLNNVNKVGPHTAISVAKCCKNLLSLDVSWCRNLTDEALGLIADSCCSLGILKVFGCTQITSKFLDGHSNPKLNVIGMNLTPVLKNLKERDLLKGPLCYSAVSLESLE